MDYQIAIPTYKRLNVFRRKTYRLLKRYNLCERVVLFLQCPEDVKEYTEAFPELKYVEAPSGFLNCINFITQHFPVGQPVVQMHDDVRQIYDLVSAGTATNPDYVKCVITEDAHSTFVRVFELMQKYKCNLGGLYPTRNARHMNDKEEYTTTLAFIHEPITMMYNQQILLDDANKTDYQRCVEYYLRDGGVLRYNHSAFTTVYNPVNADGGIGHRSAEEEQKSALAFKQRYGNYVSHILTKKNGATSLVMKDKTINKKDATQHNA